MVSPTLRVLVILLMCCHCSFGQVGQPDHAAGDIPAILTEAVPPRPTLPRDIAEEVAELDERIAAMREAFLKGEIASLDDAIELAERVYAIRVEHQSGWTDPDGNPAEWYEVGDVRLAVVGLRALVEMADADLALVLQAKLMNPEIAAAYGRGDYAESVKVVERQLQIHRQVLGDEHPLTLGSELNLGSFMLYQGRLSEAERHLRQAVDGSRRVLTSNHPKTLSAINNLGAALLERGAVSDAGPYFHEALVRKRWILGDEHPSTPRSIAWVGVLLEAQGRVIEAEPYFREALKRVRATLGDDHSETLKLIDNMGVLLGSQGRLSEAEPYSREAVRGKRRALGDDHPTTLTAIGNMGSLLKGQGRLSEAEPYCREAMEGMRRVLGRVHPRTVNSVAQMGLLLKSQGKLTEAEVLFREVLELRRRAWGDDHPETLSAINNMGYVLEAQGRLSEAERYYREALAGYRRVLGNDHLSTLNAINNMGILMLARGELVEAERHLREALEGRRRCVGDDHPDTMISMSYMASLLAEQGRFRQAESGFREALQVAERLRGLATGGELGRAAMAEKVHLRSLVTNLSILLARRGALDEAWTVSEQARGRALLDLLTRSGSAVGTQLVDSPAYQSTRIAEQEMRVALNVAELQLAATTEERAVIEVDPLLSDEARAARLVEFDAAREALLNRVAIARRDLGDATRGVYYAIQQFMPDAKPLTLEQIQSRLEPGELLLGYAWGNDRVLVLVATQTEVGGAFVTESKDETVSLAKDVVALRNTLALQPGRSTRFEPPKSLSQLVPEALQSHFGSATRVIVLPDGPLVGIPLEVSVLRAAVNSDRPQVVYASSATVYINRRDIARRKSATSHVSAVALGDPIFDRNSESDSQPEYPESGVLALSIAGNSNAANAGLSDGDVILAYDGEDVRDYEHILEIKAQRSAEVDAGERAPDDPMPVRVWRDGTIVETTMTPGAMGIQLARGNLADGLRSLQERSRGMDERIAESSMLDSVRLHGGQLPRLLGTGAEVERIASIVGDDAITLLREDATLANLEASAEGARFVHLATHGLIGSQDRPYDASLALTQPETPSVDDIGFLTLDHLIRTWSGKLESCDLVTLSACDTQRGVRQGDALMALPWGFCFAGAPTVIASLWQVDDIATSLLMGRIYENLLGGFDEPRRIGATTYAAGEPMTKIDSLREAKTWLRVLSWEERDELLSDELYADATRGVGRSRPASAGDLTARPYEHPYYWAAFVLIGDPGD